VTKTADAKIQHLKCALAAAVLREIKGLSVRQAELETGLLPITISRLRRGVARNYSLEGLIAAAINLGLPLEIHVGERPPSKISRKDGREGTRRPKAMSTVTSKGS
jgi:transcriptional regulator with XRE-family HTH domain